MISLEELQNGKSAVIKSIKSGYGLRNRLCCMNIREGKTVKKIAAQPLRGPIILKIDTMQCAIGRGMARKIMVEET